MLRRRQEKLIRGGGKKKTQSWFIDLLNWLCLLSVDYLFAFSIQYPSSRSFCCLRRMHSFKCISRVHRRMAPDSSLNFPRLSLIFCAFETLQESRRLLREQNCLNRHQTYYCRDYEACMCLVVALFVPVAVSAAGCWICIFKCVMKV